MAGLLGASWRCCSLGWGWWRSEREREPGQFSVSRLLELRGYTDRTSPRRTVAVVVLTPLPCLAWLLGIDALPLRPPSDGLARQTMGFWIRGFLYAVLVTVAAIEVVRLGVPALSMTRARQFGIAAVLALFVVSVTPAYAALVVFPAPFSIQVSATFHTVALVLVLLYMWWHILRADPAITERLRQYLRFYHVCFTVAIVYTAWGCVFTQLRGRAQTYFAASLPAMKYWFKSWMDQTLEAFEAIASISRVFSIDVFHALFLSLAMQRAARGGTMTVVVSVDVLYACVSLYKLDRLCSKISTSVLSTGFMPPRGSQPGGSKIATAIEAAARLVETDAQLRAHPLIANPRHLRITSAQTRASLVQVVPQAATTKSDDARTMAEEETARLHGVMLVLRLMYAVEKYTLVEFIKVLVAVIYAVYQYVLSMLPNRVYYVQLKNLTQPEMQSAAGDVAVYASLELVSFVAFCAVVDFRIQRLWTVRQLAFVLETRAMSVHSGLLFWITFVVNTALDHYGVDYTFQFKWMRTHQ